MTWWRLSHGFTRLFTFCILHSLPLIFFVWSYRMSSLWSSLCLLTVYAFMPCYLHERSKWMQLAMQTKRFAGRSSCIVDTVLGHSLVILGYAMEHFKQCIDFLVENLSSISMNNRHNQSHKPLYNVILLPVVRGPWAPCGRTCQVVDQRGH